jgi:hypothetical protein
MIKSLLSIIIFTLLSYDSYKTPTENSEENFDWILGQWQRTNEKPGKKTIERWVKITSLEFRGNSFTLQNKDTIWQENVRLMKDKQKWIYEVTQKNEITSTAFILTNIGKASFVCENELNEFPKKIIYKRDGSKLYAEISAGETTIPFEFKKVEK